MNIHTTRNGWTYLREKRLLGLLAALFFLVRLILCITDVNHPPSARTVRLCAVVGVLLLAALEVRRPWLGFKIGLFLWPQMLVVREVLTLYVSPLFGYLPSFWGGMLVSALCVAVWIRRERRKASNPLEKVSSPQRISDECGKDGACWIRTVHWAFYGLGGALFISALVGQWRVGLHPAGWHIQATDFRHLWEISAFDDALPLMTLLEALPTILLGLLFINMRAETDTDSSERFPRENIAGWVIASGVLVALEVLGQMAGGWHLGNDPMSFGGPFENRNTTAPLLAIFGACALVFFQSKVSAESRTNRTEARHWTVLLLALLLMGVAVVCGSRNAVCVVFVTLFLWILCGWRHSAGWARLRWSVAAGLLGLGVCVLFLRPPPKAESLQLDALSRSANSLRAAIESDWATATGDRAGMYVAAWRMYADYPATGAGLGTVPMVLWNNGPYKESITAFDKGLQVSHVHSMPLQLLAESGLLAMLSWLTIFILLPVLFMLRQKDSGVWAIPVATMGAANLFDAVWLAAGVPFFAVMLLSFILFAKQR